MAAAERPSIYQAARRIKRRDYSLYNALRSIYHDSVFVAEIAGLWPALPLLANLRCGFWYSPHFDATCYFKSTDGHQNNCTFSTARLNLHVARLAAADVDINCVDWDTSLHLPLWVPHVEKAAIEKSLDEWTKLLEDCGADIASLALILRKPLRPLWISQKTLIWLNEVPDYDSWNFTPIILVSASATDGHVQHSITSEFSWHYIPGAGDDEESWARGLTPNLFWQNAYDLIDFGPDLCNQKVAEIVEKERVYLAQRGEYSPQIVVKPHKLMVKNSSTFDVESDTSCWLENSAFSVNSIIGKLSNEKPAIFWIGSTNLAVAGTLHAINLPDDVGCVLNCDSKLEATFTFPSTNSYLHLPITTSKVDKFSVINNLSCAIDFAKLNLSKGNKLLICCHNGSFDSGNSFMHTCITKSELRRRLVFICKFALNARPSRGNLRQVFGFLSRECDPLVSLQTVCHGA